MNSNISGTILAGFFAWLDKKAEEPHNEKAAEKAPAASNKAAVKVSVVSKNAASAD